MKHEAAKLYGLMGKRKWMILAALLLAALGMQAQRVALRLAHGATTFAEHPFVS